MAREFIKPMIAIRACLIAALVVFVVPVYAKDVGRAGMSVNGAAVCAVGFRIEFAVGPTEENLLRRADCGYAIDQRMFLAMLSPRPASEFYQDRDVRARVTLSNGDVYFIDRNGVVRAGAKKFAIDTLYFMQSIKKVGAK